MPIVAAQSPDPVLAPFSDRQILHLHPHSEGHPGLPLLHQELPAHHRSPLRGRGHGGSGQGCTTASGCPLAGMTTARTGIDVKPRVAIPTLARAAFALPRSSSMATAGGLGAFLPFG